MEEASYRLVHSSCRRLGRHRPVVGASYRLVHPSCRLDSYRLGRQVEASFRLAYCYHRPAFRQVVGASFRLACCYRRPACRQEVGASYRPVRLAYCCHRPAFRQAEVGASYRLVHFACRHRPGRHQEEEVTYNLYRIQRHQAYDKSDLDRPCHRHQEKGVEESCHHSAVSLLHRHQCQSHRQVAHLYCLQASRLRHTQ